MIITEIREMRAGNIVTDRTLIGIEYNVIIMRAFWRKKKTIGQRNMSVNKN